LARRTLGIFMAAGAASGLLAGLLLMDTSGGGIVYVEGPSITVDTDRRDYQRGDLVTAVIVNSGSVPLESDGSWGFRVTGLSGMLMYEAVGAGADVLEPGMRATVTWDQIKDDGDAALEGLYRISVEGYGPERDPIRDSATFSIWK